MFDSIICELQLHLNENKFYIKRDDLIPFSFGGNKVRKTKLYFDEIINNDYDYVITYGTSSSNHVRVVANFCAINKIACIIVMPNIGISISSNLLLTKMFGCTIVESDVSNVKEEINKSILMLKQRGYNPYFIEGGGHGLLGTKAYVLAYQEILSFETKNKIYFDYIFFASGTGTTQAGLIVGSIINNDHRMIMGISIARRNPAGTDIIKESVSDYLSHIGFSVPSSININFFDDYIVDGYLTTNPKILDEVKKLLIQEGIPLDPFYTGKAFWGMKEFLISNSIKNKNILFIHTGGTPLFFDNLKCE